MDDNNKFSVSGSNSAQGGLGPVTSGNYNYQNSDSGFLSSRDQNAESPNLTPQVASDTDLIEKEWVNLLEHVTTKYAEDPYTQQVEISKIKADYIKKRYGKDINQGGQ
jgi:hypothetical protein